MSTNTVILPAGSCRITNGPCKYSLQASLFDKKVIQFSIAVLGFKQGGIEIGEKFNVTVQLLGPEDGSGESWIGECVIRRLKDLSVTETRSFYYDTRTRKGTIGEAGKKWKLV